MYQKIVSEPNPSMLERIRRCYSNGPIAGVYMLILMIVDLFLLKLIIFVIFDRFLNIIFPVKSIDVAIDFPVRDYNNNKERFGDH